MVNDLDLMRMHVDALFVHDDRQRLQAINDGSNSTAPRFWLGRTRQGNLWRFGADVSEELAGLLEALCEDEPVVEDLQTVPRHDAAYRELLVPERAWSGPAFRVPSVLGDTASVVHVTEDRVDVLRGSFDDWIADVGSEQPFLTILDAGRPVAVCSSVRVTPRAHEAGVETLEASRGRGFAPRVVRAWAAAVTRMGALPLYSTSWDNTASRRVASKLGLPLYGADYNLT